MKKSFNTKTINRKEILKHFGNSYNSIKINLFTEHLVLQSISLMYSLEVHYHKINKRKSNHSQKRKEKKSVGNLAHEYLINFFLFFWISKCSQNARNILIFQKTASTNSYMLVKFSEIPSSSTFSKILCQIKLNLMENAYSKKTKSVSISLDWLIKL